VIPNDFLADEGSLGVLGDSASTERNKDSFQARCTSLRREGWTSLVSFSSKVRFPSIKTANEISIFPEGSSTDSTRHSNRLWVQISPGRNAYPAGITTTLGRKIFGKKRQKKFVLLRGIVLRFSVSISYD
jgi:hypothetical protein